MTVIDRQCVSLSGGKRGARVLSRDQIEDLAPVHEFPPAMPIDVAEHALAHQLAALDPRHRAQMDVGKVGEGEHGGLRVVGEERDIGSFGVKLRAEPEPAESSKASRAVTFYASGSRAR